jgi:hypothetical protein
MKKILLPIALLLLAACGSSNGIVKQTFEGTEGGPIECELVGSSQPSISNSRRAVDIPQQISFQFLVSNVSADSVTVQRIQVYQHGSARIQLESAQHGYDTEIAPGHDHTFEVFANAKQVGVSRQGDSQYIVIRAEVSLTNGDSYVWTFEVPVTESLT